MDSTIPKDGPQELPEDDELLAVLKESIQEVFSMLTSSLEEAAVRKSKRGSLKVETQDGEVEETSIDIEATVSFHGKIDGFVVLRCSAEGALDVAQGLLMMDEGEVLEIDEISDALGECANMVAGLLKTKVLDPVDKFSLGLPVIHRPAISEPQYHGGSLAYRLSGGLMAAEIWFAPTEE